MSKRLSTLDNESVFSYRKGNHLSIVIIQQDREIFAAICHAINSHNIQLTLKKSLSLQVIGKLRSSNIQINGRDSYAQPPKGRPGGASYNLEMVAAQLGKSESTVSRWASNTIQPSVEQLFEIDAVFDMNLKGLLNSQAKQ